MAAGATQEKKEGLETTTVSAFGNTEKATPVAVEAEAVQEARKKEVGKRDGLTPEQRRLEALNSLVKKDEDVMKANAKKHSGVIAGDHLTVTYQIPRGELEVSKSVNFDALLGTGAFSLTLKTKDSKATETWRRALVYSTGEVMEVQRTIRTLNDGEERNISKHKWTDKKEVKGEWASQFTDGLISDAQRYAETAVASAAKKH